MATPEQIRQGFIEYAKSHGPAASNIAQVKSVDESKATCILVDEDGQAIPDVRLRPVLNGKKSFLQIPKVGSYVLAVRVEDDDDWMVIGSDELEKVVYYVGDSVFQIDDKFHFEANGKNLATVLKTLLTVIERGYQTNTGPTVKLILDTDFARVKNDLNKILK